VRMPEPTTWDEEAEEAAAAAAKAGGDGSKTGDALRAH